MGLFKRKPILDKETSDWIFDTYEWALKSFGASIFFNQTELVLPTEEYFPDVLSSEDDLAESLFRRVRKYAGMEDWPCRLEAQDEDSSPFVSPTIVISGAPTGPAGTFSVGTDAQSQYVAISYNPSQLQRPQSLVATLSHELAHYLIHSADETPPGGSDLEEHATDLVAVFMGFGVFLANSAFSFNQFSSTDGQGWQTNSQGYLSTLELSYCLALFLKLNDVEFKRVASHLEKTPKSYVKRSMSELDLLQNQIDRLRNIY